MVGNLCANKKKTEFRYFFLSFGYFKLSFQLSKRNCILLFTKIKSQIFDEKSALRAELS